MEDGCYQLILEKYQNKDGYFGGLFQAILEIARKIGLEKALGYLERCVMERRVSWLDDVLNKIEKSENLVEDGIGFFMRSIWGFRCRGRRRL